jgi:4-amino-4-deoxy-L-arabinose transferase-like glycosyltransferase
LIALCAATLPLTVHPWFDPTPDASIYLVATRSLLSGLGHTYWGEPFRMRPPGFPALLAPVVSVFGMDFAALHALVSIFGIAGVAALFAFQRTRLGAPAAWLVAASLWLLPAYQRLCNQVMSDVPGVALLLAVFLLERSAARRPDLRRELLLGVCIGLFSTVRTVVLLALPAILASRVVERLSRAEGEPGWPRFALRRLAPVAAAAWIAQLPWSEALSPPDAATPADQTARFSYAVAMWHRDEGDPSSPRIPIAEVLTTRVPERAPDMAGTLGSALETEQVSPARIVLAALLSAGSLWVLLKRRAPADFFVLGSTALFAVYFGYKPRLLLPVWVIALPALAELVQDVARRVAGARAASLLVAAGLAAFAAAHFAPRQGWGAIRCEHERLFAESAEIAERVAPDARLGTPVACDFAVALDRPVFSLHYHARRRGDAARATEEMIEKYDLDAVFVDPTEPRDRDVWDHLVKRYGDGSEDGGFERAGRWAVVPVRARG